MSEDDIDIVASTKRNKHPQGVSKAVGFRLLFWTTIALAISLGLYFLSSVTGRSGTVGFTVIVAIPLMIGALVAYVTEIYSARSAYTSATFTGLAVFVLGVLILGEAVICVLMLSVIWWPMIYLGAFIVRFLYNKEVKKRQFYSFNLIALPFFTLIIDAVVPMPIEQRTVTREVIIEASVEQVWGNLHNISDITADEGVWNISQDVLSIPRPQSAITKSAFPRPIRTSYWGEGVMFEEHITEEVLHKKLSWEFVFPDDSLRHKTDHHLDPSSDFFHIDTGGYSLEMIDENSTRLILQTDYVMQTPVNMYNALWGEFFLGDIHNNILATIKTRSEAQKHK